MVKIKKKVEDFICEKCGSAIKGNGYTDHCPNCLWSKHVDVVPGDREENCHGMMTPISVEFKSGEYIVHYQCIKCRYKHRVKTAKDDDFECILDLMK